MKLSRGDMASPRNVLLLLMAINFAAFTRAGPLGPMPNVTSSDLGMKEGSCALGDVVYMTGDEFPGAAPCERCSCTHAGVQCAPQVCESRPGCKALHRPDHCCPTYQCECEQEGRVYGNGEKLVDPADPCRVCYCQGGEVVCRRIACFVRDDCTPRLVPGRCCPEYDNCPLRGVTSLPGISSPAPTILKTENVDVPPTQSKENIKEFTIKEITPVSEIPVITDVNMKKILPSPSIEVAEYSSSKSPLIPREVTSEKNIKEADVKTESPSVVEVRLSSSASSPDVTQFTSPDNTNADSTPSKISFSAQDSLHSSIYPSNVPIIATMGVPSVTIEPLALSTTKAPIIEEEDTFDHNPAFPPLPDDLAVLRNHEDEIVPEPIVDNEHVSDDDIMGGALPPREEFKEPAPSMISTEKNLPEASTTTIKESSKIIPEMTTLEPVITISTEAPSFKENPMLNLRSAISTDILNSPSTIPEEANEELDETSAVTDETTFAGTTTILSTPKGSEESIKEKLEPSVEDKKFEPSDEIKMTSQESKTSDDITTPAPKLASTVSKETQTEKEARYEEHEQTTSEIAKTNIATEVTSQTELSSLPVETSDQNPPEVSEQTTSDKVAISTIDPLIASSKIPSTSSEVITVSRGSSSANSGFENVETTEFILASFGSSETSTDGVEIIKISAEPEMSAAIIDADSNKKNNALTDLINLVSDVASISDHTNEHAKNTMHHTTTTASISESEELIPVNAGYKSKNKNFNQNSITEIPMKTKIPNTVNKQKIVEIEDDESESVTDSLPPNDKVEPTTRRPIIDKVSDDNVSNNKTSKKDIEIITQSYVPTINRRPTKVIMKKDNEKSNSDESVAVSASDETTTDNITSNDTPLMTSVESNGSSETSVAIEQSSSTELITPNTELESSAGLSASSELDVTTEQTDASQ